MKVVGAWGVWVGRDRAGASADLLPEPQLRSAGRSAILSAPAVRSARRCRLKWAASVSCSGLSSQLGWRELGERAACGLGCSPSLASRLAPPPPCRSAAAQTVASSRPPSSRPPLPAMVSALGKRSTSALELLPASAMPLAGGVSH